MAEIVVYSSNMCGACEMVKEFLRLRGREFEERNVSVDLQGRRELLDLGIRRDAGHGDRRFTVVEGFDVDEIDAALASAG